MEKKGLFGFIENPEGNLIDYVDCMVNSGIRSIIVLEGDLSTSSSDFDTPASAPYIINLPGTARLDGYTTKAGFKGYFVSFGQDLLESIGCHGISEPVCRTLDEEDAGLIPMYFSIIRDNSANDSRSYGELAGFCMQQALALKVLR